ncbi:MAG: hypothetical protein ACRDPE_10565 [Solirubrobacterales bacterium]
MEHARHDQIEPYVTRDGSTIREWAGPGYTAEARNGDEDTMLLEEE